MFFDARQFLLCAKLVLRRVFSWFAGKILHMKFFLKILHEIIFYSWTWSFYSHHSPNKLKRYNLEEHVSEWGQSESTSSQMEWIDCFRRKSGWKWNDKMSLFPISWILLRCDWRDDQLGSPGSRAYFISLLLLLAQIVSVSFDKNQKKSPQIAQTKQNSSIILETKNTQFDFTLKL